jgi:hypothetical protein
MVDSVRDRNHPLKLESDYSSTPGSDIILTSQANEKGFVAGDGHSEVSPDPDIAHGVFDFTWYIITADESLDYLC